MLREHYFLMQEAGEVTDGGGKPSPDDFEKQADGTVTTTAKIKHGDTEIPVVYTYDENGEYLGYAVEADESEIDDDTVIEAEATILDAGKTQGRIYRDRQLQKESLKEVPTLKKQLEEQAAKIKQLEAQVNQGKPNRMTDAQAKEFFGVDTVEEVKDLQDDDYAAWLEGNAKYVASKATPVTVQTIHPTSQVQTPSKPHRKPPTSLPDGEAAAPKKKKEIDKVSSFG